jgi:hypothetical protein
MKDIIFAYDVDDTLFPMMEVVKSSLEKRFSCDFPGLTNNYNFGNYLRRNNPDIYKELESTGSFRHHFQWMDDNGYWINTYPYPGVVRSLQKKKDAGISIAAVTFRSTYDNPHKTFRNGTQRTYEWFEKHGLPIDYVKFAENKVEALQELERETGKEVMIFAEDHPAHIVRALRAGYDVAIINKPYNQRILDADITHNSSPSMPKPITQEEWEKVLDEYEPFRIPHINELEFLL